MNWIHLKDTAQLNEMIQLSEKKTIAIFKHSTRCIISKMVLNNFESEIAKLNDDSIEYYFLDLIKYRNISNAIAESLNVKHESPQLIILKNQKVIHHASHNNISSTHLV